MSSRGSGTVKSVNRKKGQTETYTGKGHFFKMEAILPGTAGGACRSGFDGGFPLNGNSLFDVGVEADGYRAGVRDTFQLRAGCFVG